MNWISERIELPTPVKCYWCACLEAILFHISTALRKKEDGFLIQVKRERERAWHSLCCCVCKATESSLCTSQVSSSGLTTRGYRQYPMTGLQCVTTLFSVQVMIPSTELLPTCTIIVYCIRGKHPVTGAITLLLGPMVITQFYCPKLMQRQCLLF